MGEPLELLALLGLNADVGTQGKTRPLRYALPLFFQRLRRRRQKDFGIPSTCVPMNDRIRFVDTGATW